MLVISFLKLSILINSTLYTVLSLHPQTLFTDIIRGQLSAMQILHVLVVVDWIQKILFA